MEVLLLVKLQASGFNFTKSSNPPWVFFTLFKLQMVPNRVKRLIFETKYSKNGPSKIYERRPLKNLE